LAIIDSLPVDRPLRVVDRLAKLSLRSDALAALQRESEALGDAVDAVGLLESMRETFELSARSAWQQRYGDIFVQAINLARRCGRRDLALELTERARSRTLLEQLSAGSRALRQPSAAEQEFEELLRTRRNALRRALEAWQGDGHMEIDELKIAVGPLGKFESLLDSDDPSKLSENAVEERLRWTNEALKEMRSVIGGEEIAAQVATLGFDQIVELLRS
jgi:hypothetical protein